MQKNPPAMPQNLVRYPSGMSVTLGNPQILSRNASKNTSVPQYAVDAAVEHHGFYPTSNNDDMFFNADPSSTARTPTQFNNPNVMTPVSMQMAGRRRLASRNPSLIFGEPSVAAEVGSVRLTRQRSALREQASFGGQPAIGASAFTTHVRQAGTIQPPHVTNSSKARSRPRQ